MIDSCNYQLFLSFNLYIYKNIYKHSHKKRKDGLEGSLERV